MTAIAWALMAAIAWGTADYLAKRCSDCMGAASTLFWCQGLGAIPLVLLMTAQGGWPHAPWRAWGLAVALGALNAVSMLALYRSFSRGVLSLVSPLAASYPVLSVALAAFWLHEHVSVGRGVAIALVVAGTIAAALAPPAPGQEGERLATGVPEALGAALGMALLMTGLPGLAPALGPWAPTLVLRVTGAGLIATGSTVLRRPLEVPTHRWWGPVLGVALLDTLGFIAYQAASVMGGVAIATPLSGSFAIVTLGWARWLLRERLRPSQALGIGAVLLGTLLVSTLP